MTNTKLLIVATHPIQYHAPWFRELAKQTSIELTVLFGMLPNAEQQSAGFNKEFSWDIPLTDGYQWQQLDNQSKNPNLSTFSGVDCPDVYRVIKQLNPDVIVIPGWHSKLLLQTLWAAKRLRIKTIMRGESNAKKPRPWHVKVLHTVFLNFFDAFLAIGKSNTQFFLNNRVHEKIIFSAPYFVENQRFIEQSNSDKLQTEVTALPNDNFCFVYAGKLIEKKNVMELLSAFKLTYEQNTFCQMIIIGDGELRDQLEAYVKQHQLPVIFYGFVNQSIVPATYALGDCFVLGSDYDETWGLVVNEAMVCGLPAIVSSRAGSSDDLIIDGETGFVYQYGDTAELSQKMTYMLENSEYAKIMGQNAKAHILKGYDVRHSVNATLEALTYLKPDQR